MRRPVRKPKPAQPDFTYGSVKVSQLINYTMEGGKKNAARKIVYGAFEVIKEKGNENPLDVFETALKNAGPVMEVRSRRIGGANYQVPREVRPERRNALALRWIIGAVRAKKGSPMHMRLADELISAAKGEGEAVKKRDNTHKMAESNRAFAHFAW